MREAECEFKPRVFFTAPWDPVGVRRGDALGLRALADEVADAVAPDLSNRINDGRWVTILAWCLARSHAVFHRRGGRSVQTRSEQTARYRWLRPLEMMWTVRTIALDREGWKARRLAGQRRISPWVLAQEKRPSRFGLSPDQFRAYRQTGMYGAYRLAFRKWPGLTLFGDGWTPGNATNQLADWMDQRLGAAARPSWALHSDDWPHERAPRLGDEGEVGWWERYWPKYLVAGRSAEALTLPRRRDDHSPLEEAELLESVAFGIDPNGNRRRKTARVMARARAATHQELCEALAEEFADDAAARLMPYLAALADAGMQAMQFVSSALDEPSLRLSEIAGTPRADALCAALAKAAARWLKQAGGSTLRHVDTAHRFAEAVRDPRPSACLKALLQPHELQGGGLRWFVLRGTKVERRTPTLGAASLYRFRLMPLARLAAQCKVIKGMPEALSTPVEDEAADDEEITERDTDA